MSILLYKRTPLQPLKSSSLKSNRRITSQKKKKLNQGLLNQLINRLPMELHMPGYNYLGPGTRFNERKSGKLGKLKQIPVNKLDQAAFEHDQAYTDYADLKHRQKADKRLRVQAEKIYKNSKNPLGERASAYLTDGVIAVKDYMEGNNRTQKSKPISHKESVEQTLQQSSLYDSDDSCTETENEFE
jgi:hypothetical protein